MKMQIFDIGTWLYPDSPLELCSEVASLDCARRGDACFQVLTDLSLSEGTKFDWHCEGLEEGMRLRVYELRPVKVARNSSEEHHDALDFERVKDFVTRRAPFEVFDLTRPITDGKLRGGRAAFFVRVDASETVEPGEKELLLRFQVGTEEGQVRIIIRVHKVVLAPAIESPYGMLHWLAPDSVPLLHGAERGSEAYYHMMEEHMKKLADMRNNYLQLPTPFAVRDEDGKITGFDFSENDRLVEIALKIGFRHICGGFVCRFKAHWDDPEYYFVWDWDTAVESLEGYRQLKLYFKGVQEFIERHHLENVYMQSLVDEPQIPNSLAYKAVVSTFRTLLPGVCLIDPVESTDLAGSCDIWVIKQAFYEKYKGIYDTLQELGEHYWVYSCGFPANKWMNHIIDLPLSATRLCTWMGVRYGMDGFLHFGYMEYAEGMDPMRDTNFPNFYHNEQRYYPAGDSSLVYGEGEHIYESVRFHVQRIGAEEAELLWRLRNVDEKACNELIDSVCTSFYDYTTDSVLVEQTHRALLEKMDRLCQKENTF